MGAAQSRCRSKSSVKHDVLISPGYPLKIGDWSGNSGGLWGYRALTSEKEPGGRQKIYIQNDVPLYIVYFEK